MPWYCVNSPDNFCYICGEVTFSTQRHPLTPMVKKDYECHFGCKVGDQDKNCAPHVCCISCATILCEWLNNTGHSMPFPFPMIWREPNNHLTDCYFCIVPPLRHGITKKKRGLSIILIFRLLFDVLCWMKLAGNFTEYRTTFSDVTSDCQDRICCGLHIEHVHSQSKI